MSSPIRELAAQIERTVHLDEDSSPWHVCPRQPVGWLFFVASYSAPGFGQLWECDSCGQGWSKVGASWHHPSEQAHVMGPDDVVLIRPSAAQRTRPPVRRGPCRGLRLARWKSRPCPWPS